jgi:hypothetical protein
VSEREREREREQAFWAGRDAILRALALGVEPPPRDWTGFGRLVYTVPAARSHTRSRAQAPQVTLRWVDPPRAPVPGG